MARTPTPAELAQRFELVTSHTLAVRSDTTLTGGFGPVSDGLVGEEPELLLQSNSDIEGDLGNSTIRFRRAAADGVSVSPLGGTNKLIWEIRNAVGEWFELAQLDVFPESITEDGAAASFDLRVSDGSGPGASGLSLMFDGSSPSIEMRAQGAGSTLYFQSDGDISLSAADTLEFAGDDFLVTADTFVYQEGATGKTAAFDLSLITEFTTGTYAFPDGDGTLSIKVAPPASAAAAGELGMWAEDDSFLYVCIASSTWKRVAIATW